MDIFEICALCEWCGQPIHNNEVKTQIKEDMYHVICADNLLEDFEDELQTSNY